MLASEAAKKAEKDAKVQEEAKRVAAAGAGNVPATTNPPVGAGNMLATTTQPVGAGNVPATTIAGSSVSVLPDCSFLTAVHTA